MKFFRIRRQHDIRKQTLDSPRSGSNFNLIYSSAFGLTLDWFYNLSKPQFSLQNREDLFISEVMCMKNLAPGCSVNISHFLHFSPDLGDNVGFCQQSPDLGA